MITCDLCGKELVGGGNVHQECFDEWVSNGGVPDSCDGEHCRQCGSWNGECACDAPDCDDQNGWEHETLDDDGNVAYKPEDRVSDCKDYYDSIPF